MKSAKIYHCETCLNTGYVRSAFGVMESCPSCAWRSAAHAQFGDGTAQAVAKSDALADGRWTPAQIGRALKISLYIGMAAALWALNHYSDSKTTAEDILEGSDAPKPTANNFSPWEPTP
jgi:hypothetical protein